jgi:hydroxymethylglutaryl-CoA lyase
MDNRQSIKLIECPRDAMQGWKHPIATDMKINYIKSLLEAGFDTIDFGSFVSPKAIPQMADTPEVYEAIKDNLGNNQLLAIIANERGAQQAASLQHISYLGFPFSISPTFQMRNTNATIEEAFERVKNIQAICLQHQKTLVVYLSMGFGNPYGDPYSELIVMEWAKKLTEAGIKILSLADTVGIATAEQVYTTTHRLISEFPAIEIGVHLHASAETRIEKLQAAFEAGCIRYDGALKGFGGCPMAKDDLVGNMDTEWMIDFFEKKSIDTGINKTALHKASALALQVFQ